MKTIVTTLLCAAIVLLPVKRSEAIIAQCGILLLVVAVVGTSVYVVHKCNEASKDPCHKCGENVPEDSTACPNCGEPFRCEDCNTELPPDSEKCPTCGTTVPEPSPVMNSLQMSQNRTDWKTVVPPSGVAYSGVKIKSFASESEFQSWLGSQANVTDVSPVAAGEMGFFRLAAVN